MQNLGALLDHFEQHMDPRVPMVSVRSTSSSEPAVQVRFDVAVNKLLNFDQMSGVAEWDVYFRLFWNDERLSYNGTSVFGAGWRSAADYVAMPSDLLWTPDVVPFKSNGNSLESLGCLIYDDAFRLQHGYNVLWSRPGNIAVHCELNLEHFPFDTQQCTLIVGPWADLTYSLRALHEGNVTNEFKGDYSSEEWEVVSTWMESVRQTYIMGVFEEVHYTMVFRRFPHYYVVNAVLPMSLVVLLSALTSWLPIEGGSGERLGFSVTLLLTIMATALFTAEMRPATREDTWLDRYQACCICLTFFPVFESVVVVWLQFIYEKVRDSDGAATPSGGSRECVDEATHQGTENGASMDAIASFRRRSSISRTMVRLTEFSSNVRSSEVSARTHTVMQANFRMRLIVYMLQKVPSLESCILGSHVSHWNPRAIDMWFRYLFMTGVLTAGAFMFSEIPANQETGRSILILLPPIYTGIGFYVLTALCVAVYLIFRILVLCSERFVHKAKALRRRRHIHQDILEV